MAIKKAIVCFLQAYLSLCFTYFEKLELSFSLSFLYLSLSLSVIIKNSDNIFEYSVRKYAEKKKILHVTKIMFTSVIIARVFLVRERFVIYVSKRCIREIIYCYSR